MSSRDRCARQNSRGDDQTSLWKVKTSTNCCKRWWEKPNFYLQDGFHALRIFCQGWILVLVTLQKCSKPIDNAKVGLSIMPDGDVDLRHRQRRARINFEAVQNSSSAVLYMLQFLGFWIASPEEKIPQCLKLHQPLKVFERIKYSV